MQYTMIRQGLFAIAILFCCPVLFAEAIPQDGEQKLADFLTNSGLQRLLIIQKENQYARETDPKQRMELARQLIRDYRHLMLNPMDRSDLPRLIKKTESVLSDFSNLDSPRIGVAKSHASFLVIESLFHDWWRNGAGMESAAPLTDRLTTLEKDIVRQRRQLEELRKDLVATIPLIQSSDSLEQRRLNEIESQLAHLDFISGWQRYFRAVMLPAPDKKLLELAHDDFYRSLHLEHSSNLDKVDSKWLELDETFARRAVLGLGLIYAAQGEFTSSMFCLDELAKLEAKFEKALWQLNAVSFARNWSLLIELVGQQDLQDVSATEKRQYYKSLTFAGIVAESFSNDEVSLKLAKQIQRAGFLGMLREFDFDSIIAVTNTHPFDFATTNSEDVWIKGVILLHQAETQPDLFLSASNTLKSALKNPNLDRLDLNRIKYLSAVAEFRNQNADSALEYLTDEVTQNEDLLLSESALWMKARILVIRARRSNNSIPSALVVLNQFDSRFPNSKFAKQVMFEKVILESKLLMPKEANALLRDIQRDNPFYPEAIAEITGNLFKIWKPLARASSPDEHDAFSKLRQAALDVVNEPRSNFQQKVASIFWLMDASISSNQDTETIEDLFARFEEISKQQDLIKPEIVEKHQFYKFRFARHYDDLSGAKLAASWLADNAITKQHRIAALGYLVEKAETEGVLLDERIKIYEKLVSEFGIDEAHLQSTRNARVAAHRYVELLMQSGHFEVASEINDRLLSAFPNRQDYVVNAARIATALNKTNQALKIWRTVAAGTRAGEPIWIEAKYNIAKIVAQSDSQRSLQIAMQTINLTDEMPQIWRLKFDELVKQLNESNSNK